MVTTPAPTPTAWKIPLYFVFAPKINESSIHNEDYFEMMRGVPDFPKIEKWQKSRRIYPISFPPPRILEPVRGNDVLFWPKKDRNNGTWGPSGFLDHPL